MGKSEEKLAIKLLKDLVALQNGAPLEREREAYEDKMREIDDFLKDASDRGMIDSHSPDPVNTLQTISDINDPANDNSQLIEFEHLNTLQEGDWFQGTEEQYRDIVFMSGQFKESFVSSFIEDCMIYGMVYSTELGNGQLENLTSLRRHKLTTEEFLRRAENTFKTKEK